MKTISLLLVTLGLVAVPTHSLKMKMTTAGAVDQGISLHINPSIVFDIKAKTSLW